jgi:hypothetical protein
MRALGSRLAGLTTCVLFLELTGCREVSAPDPASDGPAFAPAETVTDVFVEEIDFTDFFLCTSEPVHWTGTARIVVHEMSNRDAPPPSDPGVQHFTVNVTVHLTGVGEISGERYTFISSVHDNIQSVDPVLPFPTAQRFSFHDRIIGPDGLLGFATFTFKSILNGTGELVLEEEEFTEECR